MLHAVVVVVVGSLPECRMQRQKGKRQKGNFYAQMMRSPMPKSSVAAQGHCLCVCVSFVFIAELSSVVSGHDILHTFDGQPAWRRLQMPRPWVQPACKGCTRLLQDRMPSTIVMALLATATANDQQPLTATGNGQQPQVGVRPPCMNSMAIRLYILNARLPPPPPFRSSYLLEC